MQTKVVLILREGLAGGLASNAAAVLGLSMGARLTDSIGSDSKDVSGDVHPGLNTHSVPRATASSEELRQPRQQVKDDPELQMVALNEVARRTGDYNAYLEDLAATPAADIDSVGMIIHGPRGRVIKLTERLPLQCRSADWG